MGNVPTNEDYICIMYAHLFIKWYGKQPTKFQEAVISLLERHRWHNGGHIRACYL